MYSVTNLGGLGGPSAVAFDINNSGEAVGWAQTSYGDTFAFCAFPDFTLQEISAAGASDMFAYSVNRSGAVAATAYVNGQPHGMILTESSATDLGMGTYALAINDNSQVAGAANGHAQLYTKATHTDLGTLTGGSWSAAYAINNQGFVAGTSDTASGQFRGFVWTSVSGMTGLGTFGGDNSYAMSINGSGDVAGFADLPSGYQHAFLYTGSSLIDLGTLGGGSSFAYSVNDTGTVVGYSWLSGGPDPHAFVDANSAMLDLNSLIPADSGWELLQAFGINDGGQIVGTGMFDGQAQAFRLDPIRPSEADVPEPAPATLLALAIVFLAINGMLRTRTSRRP
jgi:probable HAF family extracellular repeat protein